MKIALAVVLAVHGLIHLVGFVKAFEIANVAPLERPIDRPIGLVWLLAAIAFIASAVLLFVAPRFWWAAAIPAVLLSQAVIVASWSDAKVGTIANLVILVPLALSLLDLRPSSYRARYRHEVEQALAREAPGSSPITESDLSGLPYAVRTYLRRVGVVGRPHVRNFRATFGGQMRRAANATWMDIRVEQHEFFDEKERIFFIRSSMYGIPFEGLHLYVGPAATMQVRVASLVDIVDARGPEMNQGETVTFFNDMCVLAPASLVDADVQWDEIDARTVRATFANAGNVIRATLSFDREGDLVGFVSDDRYLSSDGKTYLRYPWSTPLHDYRDFGGARLASRGEAIWREPEGDFEYARFVLESIEYNVGANSLRLSRR